MLILHHVKATFDLSQPSLLLFEVSETILVYLDDVDVGVALFEVILQMSDAFHNLALLRLQKRDLLLREIVVYRCVGQVVLKALQPLAQTLRRVLALCSLKVDDLALAWSHASGTMLLNHSVLWDLDDYLITEYTAKLKILLLVLVSVVLDAGLDSFTLVVHEVTLFHGLFHESFGLCFLILDSLELALQLVEMVSPGIQCLTTTLLLLFYCSHLKHQVLANLGVLISVDLESVICLFKLEDLLVFFFDLLVIAK